MYEIIGPLHYLIQLDDGKIQKYHVEQIRKISVTIPEMIQYESNPRFTDAPNITKEIIIDPDVVNKENKNNVNVPQSNDTVPMVNENIAQRHNENVIRAPNAPPMLRRSTRERKAPERLMYG